MRNIPPFPLTQSENKNTPRLPQIKKNKMRTTSTTSTIAHVQISDIRLLKVHDLKRKILELSKNVNEKRVSRGLLKRSVRVAVVGFPNTGKSMVINKLVGRR